MGLPNGPGLLSAGQASIVEQAGGKLFQANASKDPVQLAAKLDLEERRVKPKLKPTPNDLLKLSGASSMGFLLLNDTLNKLGGKLGGAGSLAAGEELEGNFLQNMFGENSLVSNLFGSGAEGVGKNLAKKFAPKVSALMGGSVGSLVMGGGMIAAGVLLAVKDGMQGSKQATKWGVSKFNAGVSSAFTSSSKGVKGAAAGALKYGLIGAGIGTIIPGVGTVIGAAVGVGVGTILGAVGGERTAKFFQGVAKKTGKLWEKHEATVTKIASSTIGFLLGGPVGMGVGLMINNLARSGKMQAIWKSDSTLGKKLLMTTGAIAGALWDTVSTGWKSAQGLLNKGINAMMTNSDGSRNALGKMSDFVSALPGKLLAGLDSVGEFIAGEETWGKLKDYFNEHIIGGFMRFFQGIGSWINKLFGLNDEAEKELSQKDWEKSFKKSAEYQQYEQSVRTWKESGKAGPAPESKEDYLKRMYEEQRTRVDDGIFSLDKALSAGALFGQNTPMQFNDKDDLYLMASTNPARDALTGAVETLSGLIVELASAIRDYRPQTTNTQTSIENTSIPLRELLARPGVYSI